MKQCIEYRRYLERIRLICDDFRIDSLKPRLAAIEETLREDDAINVALVGRFKAGKSSFLNSLIGRDVMPVAVLPLTSVITYMTYGPAERVGIRFLDGTAKEFRLDELADFVTEERNPENIKRVARVDVELPDLREYQGIRFVDTPGLGSAYRHNTLTSTGWLPRIGVAFLVISSVNPFSEEDRSLLKELDAHTSEIVILLTKADLISSQESSQVTGFIHKQVREYLHKDLRLLPFSNKPGFERERNETYEFIRKSIRDARNRKSGEITSHKLRSLFGKCREYLLLALSVACSKSESRRRLAERLREERAHLPDIREEIYLVAARLKSRLQAELPETFQQRKARVSELITGDLVTQIPRLKGNFEGIYKAFRERARARLVEQLGTVSDEQGVGASQDCLKTASESLSRIVRAFQDRLSHDIKEALNTGFSGIALDIDVKKPEQPAVKLEEGFMSPVEQAWFSFLTRAFRPLVNRYFIRSIPWEVEKNLHRLATQWIESVFHSIDQMSHDAVSAIENELSTIENMLNETPDQQAGIEKALSGLEEAGKTLP